MPVTLSSSPRRRRFVDCFVLAAKSLGEDMRHVIKWRHEPEDRATMFDAFADREDRRIVGREIIIDENAAIDRQSADAGPSAPD